MLSCLLALLTFCSAGLSLLLIFGNKCYSSLYLFSVSAAFFVVLISFFTKALDTLLMFLCVFLKALSRGGDNQVSRTESAVERMWRKY